MASKTTVIGPMLATERFGNFFGCRLSVVARVDLHLDSVTPAAWQCSEYCGCLCLIQEIQLTCMFALKLSPVPEYRVPQG